MSVDCAAGRSGVVEEEAARRAEGAALLDDRAAGKARIGDPARAIAEGERTGSDEDCGRQDAARNAARLRCAGKGGGVRATHRFLANVHEWKFMLTWVAKTAPPDQVAELSSKTQLDTFTTRAPSAPVA